MESRGNIGARIREAREGAGVHQDELQRRCGLPATSMSRIESGDRSVKAEELASIAAALGVSPLGLLQPDSFLGTLTMAARDASGLVAPGSVRSLLVELAELHQVLAEDGVTSAPLLVERTSPSAGWLRASNQLAAAARERLGEFGPTVDGLASAIESSFGVDVMVEDVNEPLIGASIVSDEFPFIFVNSNQEPRRALFTLAHELGHVLADNKAPGIHEDAQLGGSDRERGANAFAAALLMPDPHVREMVRPGVHGADVLASMLRRFGVSYESLVYRLHNLGIINARRRDDFRARSWRSLIQHVTDPGLRDFLSEEYASTATHSRAPQLLLQRAWDGFEKGVVSIRPYAKLLKADPDELLRTRHDSFEPEAAGEEEPEESRYEGAPF